MASDTDNAITHMCANLTLADVDDEDRSMQLPNVHVNTENDETSYYAVCRIVTNKPVKFLFFQYNIASVWQPVMGVTMKQLQPQLFLLRFYHETDLNRIVGDGPWTYEQHLIVLQKIEAGDDPKTVPLNHAELWIQIHSLPAGLRSNAVVSAIGSFLGKLVHTDGKNFGGSLRTYYRVRVLLDVTKPLKKQMKLKKDNDTWVVIDFRYERLSTYCFICEVIGHGDRVCPNIALGFYLKSEKPYGSWVRAGSRRNAPSVGQKWVAPELDVEHKEWKASGMSLTDATLGSEEQPVYVAADLKRKRVDSGTKNL
ncbi:PREDICTED: uncharacterized protein LOC109157334 [Ipomoea nil]|uniref:uncharacterized protein LOC109157334 n=1 Tax=Ipomoea nil TaxID=35883 RepID=UPI000901EE00|nr:PREDICTED: uncharacterized protein LOC109157334 [Ipomoea nil]